MRQNERSKIILLNGVGSVGKTSTARAIQAVAIRPLLHVAMDAFLEMMPQTLFGHPDGLVFDQVGRSAPEIAISTGPVLERILSGMRRAVAAIAGEGNHLVVDEVLIGKEAEEDYRKLLEGFDLHMVGLFAPLDVLEARERQRGDRDIGLARWQYDRVHQGRTYDFTLDTTTGSPEEIARIICARFDL